MKSLFVESRENAVCDNNDAEKNYDRIQKECLAIVGAFLFFCPTAGVVDSSSILTVRASI